MPEKIGIEIIPLNKIILDEEYQCRRGKTRIDEIASSVKRFGLVNLPQVELREDGYYHVISGFTRINALKKIDSNGSIECLVIKCKDDEERALTNLVDNMLRFPVDEPGYGWILWKLYNKKKEENPEYSERDFINDVAEKTGIPKGRLIVAWVAFKNNKKVLQKAYEEETRLPEQDRAFPSHIRRCGRLASIIKAPNTFNIEKMIAHVHLPSRGQDRLIKVTRTLQLQNFFKQMSIDEIYEWLEQTAREWRKNGIQATFWFHNGKQIADEIKNFCDAHNYFRDDFITELLKKAWKQYKEEHKEMFLEAFSK